jgi:hypothetical protein
LSCRGSIVVYCVVIETRNVEAVSSGAIFTWFTCPSQEFHAVHVALLSSNDLLVKSRVVDGKISDLKMEDEHKASALYIMN